MNVKRLLALLVVSACAGAGAADFAEFWHGPAMPTRMELEYERVSRFRPGTAYAWMLADELGDSDTTHVLVASGAVRVHLLPRHWNKGRRKQ